MRIDPQGATFTSTHLALAKFAYDKDIIGPSLDVINRDIVFFATTGGSPVKQSSITLCDPTLTPAAYISAGNLSSSVRYADVLDYDFTCGLIHTSQRNWRRAKEAYERVLSHPIKDKTISKYMTEAHPRWLLVGLLADGKAPSLSSTAGEARRSYQALSKQYQDLANLFESDDAAGLRAAAEEHNLRWVDDGTLSLIKEVCQAYQQRQIIRLQDVFQHVSISYIRESTVSGVTGERCKSDEEVLNLIKSMLSSGALKGDIAMGQDGASTYLTFRSDQNSLTEVEFAREIASSKARIEILTEQYSVVNTKLSKSQDYIKYLAKEQVRADKEAPAATDFDAEIEEEDLMTDVVSHR